SMKHSHAAKAARERRVWEPVSGSRMPERPFGGVYPRERPLRGPPPGGANGRSRELRKKEGDARRTGRNWRARPHHFRHVASGIAARDSPDHLSREIRKSHSVSAIAKFLVATRSAPSTRAVIARATHVHL